MTDPRQLQFWDDEEDELWDSLQDLLIQTYMSGIEGGTDTLPTNVQPLVDYNHVNQAALNFSHSYRYQWIKGITETSRTQVQQAIADWMREGTPLSALEAKLGPIFGDARAAMIAATEVTRVYSQANMDAWESTGMVDSSTWMTAEDDLVCPICGELDGTDVGLGDRDAAPPAHVNCRCYLQPHVSEEMVHNKLLEIFS